MLIPFEDEYHHDVSDPRTYTNTLRSYTIRGQLHMEEQKDSTSKLMFHQRVFEAFIF